MKTLTPQCQLILAHLRKEHLVLMAESQAAKNTAENIKALISQ